MHVAWNIVGNRSAGENLSKTCRLAFWPGFCGGRIAIDFIRRDVKVVRQKRIVAFSSTVEYACQVPGGNYNGRVSECVFSCLSGRMNVVQRHDSLEQGEQKGLTPLRRRP